MTPEEIDILWKFYQDQMTHARHHETLRATTTTVMLAVVAGVLALIGSQHSWPVDRSTWPLDLFLVILGVFGYFFTAKYHERYNFYANRALAYQGALSSGMPDAKIKELESEADELSKKKPFYHSRLHHFWEALHGLIALLGVVLFIFALANPHPRAKTPDPQAGDPSSISRSPIR